MKYIKSPLNYVGGKYKLLNDIIPLFPEKINTFVDLFGGGFNVGINVHAEHIIYNEFNPKIVEIIQTFCLTDVQELLSIIDNNIKKYNLTKENKEGFLKLREDYNRHNNALTLYTLICFSFNNQIRFNSKGEYNMPFGKNRSDFNPTLRKKFIDFCNQLQNIDVAFMNESFDKIDFSDFTSEDLIYCDPPYLNSIATYNEKKGWTEENEIILLNLLDELNKKNIKFALSNNLKYNNNLLDEWKNKYKIHYFNYDYSNCSYNKIDKSKDIEVLITNY